MTNEDRIKEQLTNELVKQRQRVAELETNPSQVDERIKHLNLVLRAIRNVNQLIIKEKDRDRLLKGACDNLIENRGYYNAWIALLDESRGLVTTAEAGLGKDFLPLLKQLERGDLTECGRKALSQPAAVVTEDPRAICGDCPLSTMYGGRGGLTVRLEHAGKIYGLLSASIPRDFLADEEEQSLLQEVAGDIAFALHSLELEEQRKGVENALRESETKYRAIFETTGTATIIIEEDTTISTANAEFEQLSGYSKKEIEGEKSWTEFVAQDDLEKMREYHQLRRANPDAAPRSYEFKFIDRDGSVKDILGTVDIIPGTKKSVASFLDITERKRAENSLRESEKRFRDLVEHSLTGISIIQNDRIAYQNPEHERLFGPLPDGLEFLHFEGIHSDDSEKVKGFFQRITSGQVETLDTDFRFYPPGKTDSNIDMKWVHCRASSIKYQGEQAILLNMVDMTRAKELEHLLRIQDKMISLGRVAAGIAHEIRNPLSGINIYVNALEKIYNESRGFEKVEDILSQLQSASNKIESVIKRVMDFAKPSEPKFVLTDLNKPIEDAISLSSVTLRKRGIKIEKCLAQDLPPVQADQQLMEEVILNLITNAAEAMKNVEGVKNIEVTSCVENNRILVSVSDSGPGVPSNVRDKIFDPFYSTTNGSTGIGLSLSHRIVTDHGGTLDVFTSKWGGAEFRIQIPIERETGKR